MVLKPAAACGGCLVPAKSAWWHDTHAVDFPANTPSAWQSLQLRPAWALVSWNAVFEWSKTAPFHWLVV